MKNKRILSTLSVLCAGILWGCMGYFRRRLGDIGLEAGNIILIRCGIAAVGYALIMAAADRKAFIIRPKDWWIFLGLGIVSVLFFTVCYFQAMMLMSLSAAAILLYTAPVFVILLSALLFKEKITARKILAMLLAFSGCCLTSGIIGSSSTVTFVGILYGLGSGIGYALYSIFGKFAIQRGYGPFSITFYASFLAALGAGLIWGFEKPFAVMTASPTNALLCLGAGIITCLLPYLLYTKGIQGMEAGKASVIASVEPVVATLVGMLAFGEVLTPWNAIGIALVLTAIALIG